MTKEKIERAEKSRRRTPRALRAVIAAAAVLTALSLTAFAAYENNWFGFADLFGEETALVAGDVTRYPDAPTEPITAQTPTEPVETPSDPRSYMESVANEHPPAEAGTWADVGSFRISIQELLAGRDTLLAIVRVDAATDEAAAALAVCGDERYPGEQGGFTLIAERVAVGREGERTNGAMGMQRLRVDGARAWFLLTNTGADFARGDEVRIHMLDGGRGKDLFTVTVETVLETETTLSLDAAYDGYRLESLTVTPIGLTVTGSYEPPLNRAKMPSVTLTLKDGTRFTLLGPDNEDYADYGSYGTLAASGTGGLQDDPFLLYSWTFSRLIDPAALAEITVDGVTYPVE